MRGSFLPDFLFPSFLFRVFRFRVFLFPGFSLDVILNLQTAQSGMTSEPGMHLYFTICPVRDEISEGESSLGEDFYPQG